MWALAATGRFEDAAATRDRAAALAVALHRTGRLSALRQVEHAELEWRGWGGVELYRGRLVRAWGADGVVTLLDPPGPGHTGDTGGDDETVTGRVAGARHPDEEPGAVDRADADELLVVARWFDDHAGQIRVRRADPGLTWPLPRLRRYAPSSGRREAGEPGQRGSGRAAHR